MKKIALSALLARSGLLATALLLAAATSARAATEHWIGVPGVSATTNWSDANNWSAPQQTWYNQVQFLGSGMSATNDFAVNNILDTTAAPLASQVPIWELDFAFTNANDTTLLDPGVTLLLGAGRGYLYVGADQLNTANPAPANAQETVTLEGPQAALSVQGNVLVNQGSPLGGDIHNITLDLSQLDTFIDTGSEILVASGGAERGNGSIFLARTNEVSLGDDFLLCNQTASNSMPCNVYLGITNSIYTGSGNLTIGGTGTTTAGASMKFNPAFVGGAVTPMAYLGGTGSDGRIVNFWIANANGGPQVSGNAAVDFTGGNVALYARSMQLGQAGNAGANATGTLTLDNGVVDVNTAVIGSQEVSGGGIAVGIVNLNSNATLQASATLRVNDSLTLGAVSGSLTTGSGGTININGGALSANSIANGGGAAVINVTNGFFTMAGLNGYSGAPLTSVSLVNATLSMAFIRSGANISTASLVTGGASNIINITSVPPSPSYPVQVTLFKYSGSLGGAGFNFALGTVPSQCVGYISNNAANGSVDLVLTAGPLTDTWTGSINGDWDTTTANWTDGNPVDYEDGAFVQFLDGAVTSTVNLTTTLSPGGTTVSNNTQTYTFTGSGSLSGPGALVKSGAGTLVIDNAPANNFTGGVTINGGVLQIGTNDSNGSLPAGAITDNGTLAFDRSDSPTFANAITGNGSVVQQGAGSTLVLSGGNTFTGNVVVTNGSVLKLGGNGALGAGGNAVIASGSTLDANGYSATKTLIVSGAGFGGQGVLTDSGGAIYDNPGPGVGTNIVLAGDATFSFPTRWDLGSANGGSVLTATGPYTLTLNGTGYFEWRNLSVLSPLSGINIASGNLGVTGNMTFGDPSGTLTIQNAAAFTLYGASVVVDKNIDFQNGGVINNAYGANTLVGGMTLQAGFSQFDVSGGTTLIVSNVLTGPGNFYLQGGTGTTVLAGNSPAFTGGVALYGGQLTLNGSIGSGIVSQSSTTVAGSGAAAGLVDISGDFEPGGIGAAGTFTAGGGLTLESGATMTMDLGPATGSGSDVVAVTGDLTVNGNNINLNPLSGSLAVGSYTLFTYSGNLNGSFGSVATAAQSRYSFTLDTSTPHVVKLNVAGQGNLLAWNNGSGNSQWDVQSSLNWSNLTTRAEDVFFTSDEVILDDSILLAANPSTSITIPSGTVVIPSVLTNNSTTNYTISGSGQISGGASVIKAGPSTLTISTVNNFTGNITLGGGSLEAVGQMTDAASPIGASTGTVFITNGAQLLLDLTGGYPAGDIGLGNKPVVVSGAGVDGKGAIQNVGNSIYNDGSTLLGLGKSVTLLGDTTIGGTARWDWGYPGLGATLSTRGSNYNFTIIEPGYTQWQDLAIDTNLGNIDYYTTASSQQTWVVSAMGGSLGNPTNVLTLHTNVEMQIGHGDINAFDSGYAKVIHVLPTAVFDFQPNGGNGDYHLATSLILESNATFAFYNGTGGNGTGTVINGAVVLNGLAHLTIGDSTVTFSNVISGPGGFYWDTYNNTVAFAAANTYQGITDIRSGRTLALIGAGSIADSAIISLAASATLDVTGRADQQLTLASGQTLIGDGAVAGNLLAGSGSTVAPGGTNSIGTLSVSGAVTLGGTTIMDVNKTAASSDQISGAASIAYGGALQLNNLAGTLAAGDTFQLFSAGSYSGSFSSITPAPGPGLAWSISAGAATVVSTSGTQPQPKIGAISVANGKITLSGQYSGTNTSFEVLTTTNIALPAAQWTVLTNGAFASGSFSSTNDVGTNADQFYLIKVQ